MKMLLAGLASVMLLGVVDGVAAADRGDVPRSGLIARANAFCLAVKLELHSLEGRGGVLEVHSPRARQAARVVDRRLNGLKSTRPAAAAAAPWEAFIGAATGVDRSLLAFVRAPAPQLTSLLTLASGARAAGAAGVELGARDCAS
jgi:hypothetical protein